MGLISKVFRGIGSTIDDMMSGAGNVGASVSYLTGRTGRLLQEGAEESIRRNGRILNRQEQARGVFNRTTLKGQIVQERLAMQGPAPLTRVKDAVNTLASQDIRYATNTTKYEKALASRARAKSFLGYRVAPAAALIGGGYIGGAMMRNVVEQRKAYYGEEMYASRYGEGGERAASLIETAGLVLGGSALFGMDPVSGTAKLVARRKEYYKYGALVKKQSKEIKKVKREMAFEAKKQAMRNAKMEQLRGPTGPLKSVKRIDDSTTLIMPISAKKRYPLFNTGEIMDPRRGSVDSLISRFKANRAARRARKDFVGGFQPHTTGTGRPARRQRVVKSQRRDRQAQRLADEASEGAYNESLARSRFKDTMRAEKRVIKDRYKEMRQSAKGRNHEQNLERIERLQKQKAKFIKGMESKKRMAGLYSGSILGTAAAVGGAGAILYPEPMTAIALTAGIGTIMAPKAVGFALRHKAAVAVAGATVATGAAIGMNTPRYAAAEGNIQEVNYARQSATQKLNYSTAGLVQAIHNNRRM